MVVTGKTRKALREVGLTEYEIRAYVTLLESGPLTANQVSKKAGLPYSKIYDVLQDLKGKGWIDVKDERPKVYYPKPPSEAMEITRMRVEESLRHLESQVLMELEPIYERRGIQERPDIWIIRGIFNIATKTREILGRSRSKIMLALPFFEEKLINALTPDLIRVKNTGVKVMLMITEEADKDSLKKIMGLAEIRMRDQMFGGGVISDDKEAMLFLIGKNREALAIQSEHLGLTKLAKEYFEYLWKDARPLSP